MVSLRENNYMANFSFVLSRDLEPSLHHLSATLVVSITLTLLFIAILSIMWWKRIYLMVMWKRMFGSCPKGRSSDEFVDQLSISLCFKIISKFLSNLGIWLHTSSLLTSHCCSQRWLLMERFLKINFPLIKNADPISIQNLLQVLNFCVYCNP